MSATAAIRFPNRWPDPHSGWYLAIGAAGPPPDQWEYDGAVPPGGFPGLHPDWGDGPFTFDACANW